MTHRTWLTGLLILAAIAGPLAQGQPRGKPHSRLFPPQDLGLLEAPDRDIWQHPDQIMDTLSIAEASIISPATRVDAGRMRLSYTARAASGLHSSRWNSARCHQL